MKKEQTEDVRKASQQLGDELSQERSTRDSKKKFEEVLTQMRPQNLMGMSDADIENLYSQAYRLYNNGKYKDAHDVFQMLSLIKAEDVRYPLGLAACFHMMKEYASATNIYNLCGVIDPHCPIYHYHVADCYIKMEDPLAAIISLEMAVKRAGEQPEFQALKDRSKMMIESLKKQMKPKKGKTKKNNKKEG